MLALFPGSFLPFVTYCTPCYNSEEEPGIEARCCSMFHEGNCSNLYIILGITFFAVGHV